VRSGLRHPTSAYFLARELLKHQRRVQAQRRKEEEAKKAATEQWKAAAKQKLATEQRKTDGSQ